VYDPFVGMGGVLLAAAHHGAATLGSDIDMRVIRLGKTDKTGKQVPTCRHCCQHSLPARFKHRSTCLHGSAAGQGWAPEFTADIVKCGRSVSRRSINNQVDPDNPTQVDLWTNFRDYGLRPPVGLLRADAHTMPFRRGYCNTQIASDLCEPPGCSIVALQALI
jgi:hypothetical protein